MGIHLRRRHPYRRACGGSGENEEYGRVAAYIKARGIRPGNAGQIPLTFIEQEGRCGDTFPAAVLLILVRKVYRPANGCKALDAGDHHIVVSAGAVDDEQIAALIPAAYDAHVGVLWVKYQIAGHRLIPRNGGTVTVLCRCPSPVADDVLAARGVVEYPVDIP